MKKRVWSLILVLLMVLGLAACGDDGKDSNPDLIEIGDYQALYQGAWITKDYDGDDAIVIPFTFTNNSDEAASFMWSLFYTAKQGDAELEIATVFVSEDSFDTLTDDLLTDVEPGASLDLAITYKLQNLTDTLELKFSDLLEDETDQLTIEVSALESKTASDNGGETPDEAPTEAEGAISFDEYVVTLVESEIVLDNAGRLTLVLGYDYTNKDSSASSYAWSVYDTGYQGGTELDTTDIYVEGPASLRDSSYEDVEPNETLRVYEMYLLQDLTTPVEVQFTDLFETKVETLVIDPATVPNHAGPAEGETEDETEPVGVGYAFDADFADAYAGDWHGMAEFYECTGDYSDEDGLQCEIVARFVFDENGYCTPYIRLCLSQPEEQNFVIDSMDYDADYDCMLINGMLSDQYLDPIESYVELDGDVMYIGASFDDGSGDVFNVLGCLRRLDDTWDYENDYPYLPEAGVEFYMGMTMEEIVDLYGYDTSLLPALTDGSDAGEQEAQPEGPELPFETGIAVGDGIVELQQLKDLKEYIYGVNTYENDYYTPTYEECLEQIGVDPAPSRPEKWEDDYIAYVWSTADGKEKLTLTLQPTEDGTGWRYKAVSFTSGVNG